MGYVVPHCTGWWGGMGLPQMEQDREHHLRQEVVSWGQSAWPEQNPGWSHTEERWEKNCLHRCSAGESKGGNGHGQLCQRDVEGILVSAHIMRRVKEIQPQRWTFILLCSLLFISRKLSVVRLKLQEDSRVPVFLMSLLIAGQQYPEHFNEQPTS